MTVRYFTLTTLRLRSVPTPPGHLRVTGIQSFVNQALIMSGFFRHPLIEILCEACIAFQRDGRQTQT